MEQDRIRVLLIGDCRHPEFAEPRRQLAAETDLEQVASVTAALTLLQRDTKPWHVVVFAQLRPGRFRQADIERVHHAVPLARLVALLGSWCEGESRSGRPWSGVIRVYWHQWTARWPAQCAAAGAALPAGWELPRTAAPVEHVLTTLDQSQPPPYATVGIVTARSSFYDALARACASENMNALRLRAGTLAQNTPLDVLLWEPNAMRGQGWEQLRAVAAALPSVPIVALLSFPRYHDAARARQLGAAAVVSCPFQLPELWTVLRCVRS